MNFDDINVLEHSDKVVQTNPVGWEVSEYVEMNRGVVARLTGCVFLSAPGKGEEDRRRLNIGLDLKRNTKEIQVCGWTLELRAVCVCGLI